MTQGNQNDNISQMLAQVVDGLVTSRINKAGFDKTYSGIISEILFEPDTDIKDVKFGTYKVRYGGIEQKVRLGDGIIHEVGERVDVYVPQNNPNRTIVEPIVHSYTPCKIRYNEDLENDEENNRGELNFFYKTITNQKEYNLERIYQIEYENKGTQNKTPKKIITPEGREIELEGF